MKHPLPEEDRKRVLAAIAVIAAGAGIILFTQKIEEIFSFLGALLHTLLPVLAGVVIAYFLSPTQRRIEHALMNRCEKKHKKARPGLCRSISVLTSFLIFLLLAAALLGIVIPQVLRSLKAMIEQLIDFINNNSAWVNEVLEKIGIMTVDGDDFIVAWENIISRMLNNFSSLFNNALQITTATYHIILNTLVSIAVSIYALFEKDRFAAQMKKLVYSIFPRDASNALVYWMRRSNRIFSGFISGKIYDSMIMGVLCYVCMRILRMPYPELVSTIFGVTNIVPFFGPIVGGVIGALLLLIIDLKTAVVFAILALILQQIDGNLIGPHILHGTIGLSAFWIMLSILVGGGMFGFPGMLLGAPVFSIIYAVIKSLAELRLNRKGLPIESSAYFDAPDSLKRYKGRTAGPATEPAAEHSEERGSKGESSGKEKPHEKMSKKKRGRA